jgi:hypothetical protein
MRRTILGLCFGLAAFAAGNFLASSFERRMYVPSDLVSAPAVEELKAAPALLTRVCKLHGYEMKPDVGTMEGASICSNYREIAEDESKGVFERRFPYLCRAEGTGVRGKYGEVILIYSCPECVAAYRKWERR